MWSRGRGALPIAVSRAVGDRAAEMRAGTPKESVLRAIRFVQDDVRYLANRSALFAAAAPRPAQVLKQRFGDCRTSRI